MADVTAKMVKELRDMTGVGMMDAKSISKSRRRHGKSRRLLREMVWLKQRRKMTALRLKV